MQVQKHLPTFKLTTQHIIKSTEYLEHTFTRQALV